MKCLSFKPLRRGSLQGFADLAMDSGLVLLGCTYHHVNGKAWCSPPARPQLDRERRLVIDEGGKVAYAPVVEFADAKTRYRWSAEGVAAIDAYLQQSARGEAGAMNSG